MGRRNSSLSDELGKWVLLKSVVFFQQNLFSTKPMSTKSKENGFC
jgi:hypothetical protein